MEVIKFRDNTMVCGCITNIIYGVVKLNFGIRQECCTEMEVIKFRDNTMVCGCITNIIYGVVKLNFGIRRECCIDCVCDLLQVLNLCM